MHKTTTLKDFKVLVLKTFLTILVLGISFQVSFAQGLVNPKKAGRTQTPTSAVAPVITKGMVKGDRSSLPALMSTATPTDVPAVNRQIAEKLSKNPAPTPTVSLNSPTTNNIVNAVCTFNGSLAAGDPTLDNGRPFRSGIASSCAAPTACGAPFAGSGFFYDTYSMQNLTCAAQCVSVTYQVSPGGTGDVFVSAYLGSFDPTNLCANRIADGGSSSVAAGTTVTFSFNLAVNATVIFVANIAFAAPCTAYDMTVTGLTCTPPPPCTPITSAILSQTQYAGPPATVLTEGFNTSTVFPASGLPAGWLYQMNSQPAGLITVWYSGNQTGVFPGQTGDYIAGNYNHAGAALGTLSSWIFVPPVAGGYKNGDQFSFWTCHDPGNARPDRLQVRMNTTNNGVNVGATATSVGDFTTVLLDINPLYQTTGYPTTWTQYTLTMSGLPAGGTTNARLAFRYFCENSGGVGIGINSDYIGIDEVRYVTFPLITPQTCTGSTTNLKVDITGGTPGAVYNMVLNANPPGGPAGNFNVPNYTSGNNIPVSPLVNTTYSIVSIVDANNPCCVSTNNSGTPTVTVSALPITPISIQENPTGPLCAGDPKLLTVIGASLTYTFANPAPVVINASGVGTPYPSVIAVAGVPLGATVQNVRLINISHTWGNDVDIALGNPGGALNTILMSDIGSTVAIPNATYTFQDGAPALAAGAANPTGTYRPTNPDLGDNWPAPGPGAINTTTPTLATFGAGNHNGNWNLWVFDDVGGDQGLIGGGWEISFVAPPAPPPVGWTFLWSPAAGLSSVTSNPVAASPSTTRQYSVLGTAPNGCNTSASVLITVYQLPAVTSNPTNITACQGTNVSFTVGATGQGITYQWQLSTTGAGGPWSNVSGAPYSGEQTATLTITGVTAAMNGYRYRCMISGTCPPAALSTGAILTVNPLPAVSVSPVSPVCGGVPGVNGTALTASGATGTYIWAPVAGLYTSNTTTPANAYTGTNLATVYAAPTVNTVYTVTGTNTGTGCFNTATVNVVYRPAAPTVNPANVAMCLGDNAVQLCISSSLAPAPFTSTYSSGPINVPFPGPPTNPTPLNGASHSIAVPLPPTAAITRVEVNMNIAHTWAGDYVVVLRAPNNQVLNLDYFLSNTGAGPSTGFTNTRFASNGVNAIGGSTSPYNGIFKADAQTVATANGPTGPNGMTATTGTWAPLYTTPNGNWTLGMYDPFAGDDGALTSWSITFDYLYGPPASGVWSPATGLFRDAAATIPYVAGDTANCVYARPTPSGVYPYNVTVTSVGFDAFPVFSNPAPITIPSSGTGTPYPSNIVVSGLPTSGANVENVIIRNISHTWSNDVDILLQSPSGQNVVLMSDVGGTGAINATYTFNDGGAAMNTGAPNPTGTYHPTDFSDGSGADNYPAPGPGTFSQANAALGLFGSTTNHNGTWRLLVVDDVGGDQGTIANGWSIGFKHPTPGCTSPARTVNVTVNQPTTVVTQPLAQTVCTDKVATFTVAVAGSGPFSYQWEESTDGGNTYNPISNGGVYSGATTTTLTITAPPVTMSGYVYRCRIQGALPCAAIFSFFRVLTVNPLPTIVIGTPPYVVSLFPGMTTTLTSTVSPVAGVLFTWLRDGVPVAGANTGILSNIDIDRLGAYQLRVTDFNGCTNISNTVIVKDSVSSKCFIYPNPSDGSFDVRYYSAANNVLPRMLTVFDSKGNRVLTQTYSIGRPYDRMHVDLRKNGKGLYWVEIGDRNGNRLTMCRVVIQ